MINIRTLRKIENNGGLTLKNGKPITYKSGWQVATEGVECRTAREAINAVKAFSGDCGIWLENETYFIDLSYRVSTKKEAIQIAKKCNQISILKWSDMSLHYIK